LHLVEPRIYFQWILLTACSSALALALLRTCGKEVDN
jgi:hypothetical protein